MRTSPLLFALLCVVFAGAGLAAEEPRELNWQDLAPEMEDIDNPFLDLTLDQTLTFRDYLDQLAVPELEHTPEQQQRQRELRAELEGYGFEPDEMVRQYETLVEKYDRAMTAIVPEVLGEQVKLPGYLLPLDVKDGTVTEFLLVPTIGACIHEPVPPANQMVYVRFEEGFKQAGYYEPVWIRGELKSDPRSHDLYLMDGSSDVQVAYSMEAESVQPY